MNTREEAVADTMMEDIADVINDHNDSDADNQESIPQMKTEYSSEEGESPLSDRSATHSGSCRSKPSLSNGSGQVTTVGISRKSEFCSASNDSSQAKETDAVTHCLENRSLQETVSHHTDAHSDFGPPYMLPHTSSHKLPTPNAKCRHKAEPSLPDGFPVIANQSNISRYIEDIIKDSLKSGNVFQTQQSQIKHHKCEQCQYSCNFLFELSQHKMSHILGSLYVCDLCQSSYQYFIDLKTHLLLHAADMTSLSEQFDNYSQCYHGLKKSGELEHNKEFSFTCSICQLLCRDMKELKRHELMHTDEQQFSSDMDTFSHSGEQEKQSVLCQDNSTGSKQIGKSMKEHSHTCSICQFSCSSAKQLKMHGKIHVKSKPSSSNVVDSPRKKVDRVKKKERIRKTKMPDSVKKQYSCESCDYKCRSKSQLKVHMKEHGDTKTYSCDLCNLKFSQLSRYKRHKKVHIGGEKLYSCDLCPFTGAKARDLKVHQRQHTGEKPYSCDVCKCTFTQWGHLQLHRRLHTDEKPFSCEFCDYTCSRSDSLKRHRRVHTGEKPYSCEFCEYKCAQINQLREHRRKHTGEKPFKCDFCGSFFKQYSTFQRHRKRHLEAFYCDLCDFKCKKLEDLEIHKKVHTKKPTYPSYLYDINACKQIVELVEQSKRESEVRPYSCDNCEYTCSRLDALKRHRRLHTGEKPYACDLCDYTCSQPDHLKRHRRVHTGERPYICDLCSRTFTESGHLKVHRRLHTGEKPYSCSLCKFTCARLDGLKRHQKSHAAVLPVIADI